MLNKPEVDPLAVGLTRPAMFMGVSVRSFFLNVILCMLVYLHLHTFWALPLFGLLHAVMVRLSIKEPDFLLLHTKAFAKTPPLLNRWYWGKTNSYEPW